MPSHNYDPFADATSALSMAIMEEVLGNYRLLGPLGAGGMGQVFLAEHLLLGRRAAVKVLHPELSCTGEALARFFNEARASAALHHPGLIDVYDYGRDDAGRAYIVMELLEGLSLRGLLERESKLAPRLALGVAQQIAEAMAVAHAHGIVHRDLKPENLFLVPDAQIPLGWRVKVLDFGIAKLFGDALTKPVATRTGNILGTPTYMAPEQCHGASHVDARADVYSLGCILFEMLGGQPPFPGEGVGEVIGAHLHQEPPAITSLAPELPDEFDAALAELLAKSPDARTPSMADVVRLLAWLPLPESDDPPEVIALAWSDTLATGSTASGVAPLVRASTPARSTPKRSAPRPGRTPRGSTPPPRSPTARARDAQTPPRDATPVPGTGRATAASTDSTHATTVTPPPGAAPLPFAAQLTTLGSATAAIRPRARSRRFRWREAIAIAITAFGLAAAMAWPWHASSGPDAAGAASAITDAATVMVTRPRPEPAAVRPGTPTPTAKPAAPTSVQLLVESQPSGALVTRERDGVVLGRTPLELHLDRVPTGRLAVTLEKSGFRTSLAELPLDRDARVELELVPRGRSSGSRKPSAAGKPPAPSRPAPIKDGTLDPYGD